MSTKSIEQSYKKLQRIFPQLKLVKLIQIKQKASKQYHGFTYHKKDQSSKMIEQQKIKYVKVLATRIQLNFNIQNSFYVLLHQIAHCLTPYVWRKNKQNQWEYKQHDRIFYQKLHEIVKIAYKQDIYHKQFDNINHLMKYDKSI